MKLLFFLIIVLFGNSITYAKQIIDGLIDNNRYYILDISSSSQLSSMEHPDFYPYKNYYLRNLHIKITPDNKKTSSDFTKYKTLIVNATLNLISFDKKNDVYKFKINFDKNLKFIDYDNNHIKLFLSDLDEITIKNFPDKILKGKFNHTNDPYPIVPNGPADEFISFNVSDRKNFRTIFLTILRPLPIRFNLKNLSD